MVGNNSTKMISDHTGGSLASATVHPQRARDEVGLYFVDCTVDAADLDLAVRVQGRPDASAAWYTIQNIVEGDLSSGTSGGTVAVIVALFPQMRVNCTKVSGTNPVLNAWLIQ